MNSEPKRTVTVHKSTLGSAEAEAWDEAFWLSVPPERRVAAVWDMTLDLVRMGKLDEQSLRIRRDVVRLGFRKR